MTRPFTSLLAFTVVLAIAGFLARLEPPDPVSIVAVGDIMLSRNVAMKMRDADDPLLPFRNVSALLDSSDLNFANLESPFAAPRAEAPKWDGVIGGKSLVFASPSKAMEALRRFNFQVVAMANNHALDQGEAGLAHTLERLSADRIQAAGAGDCLEQAWQPRIVELKGRKIAFLAASYASLNYGADERNEYVARIEDLDRLRSVLRAIRSSADFILVAMHGGDEYTAEPGPAQVLFAKAAIDAGADVVIGCHPHWLQPVERYKGGLIFYSLGNFIFDLDSSPATRQGAAVRLWIDSGRLIHAEVIPIVIENACCPRPARRDEIPGALQRMRLRSTSVPLPRRFGIDRTAREARGALRGPGL